MSFRCQICGFGYFDLQQAFILRLIGNMFIRGSSASPAFISLYCCFHVLAEPYLFGSVGVIIMRRDTILLKILHYSFLLMYFFVTGTWYS